jgi:hypothetical protein
MARVEISLETGNDAMQTPEDAADAIRRAAVI